MIRFGVCVKLNSLDYISGTHNGGKIVDLAMALCVSGWLNDVIF